MLTNRNFIRCRLGNEHSTRKIDATTRELVAQVFDENGVSASHPTVATLRKACHVLDNQLGFESDSNLLEHHHQIIKRLFDLAS